jgi:transcriptional regulator with GAF, ATPase, and Fis domain
LFGHEKGSFTGATHAKAGKFLAADGGTIFLDEIGEMPLDFQVKLLRVLQEKEVTPVGSNRSMKVNFRVVAATNRDLKEEVKKGNFREDLFYRLNILPIEIPSLMKRREDIISIAKFIIEEKNNETGQIKKLTDDALGTMKSYNWPGNVRQLEAVLKRAYVLNGLSINSKAVEQQIESDQDEYCYKYGILSWKDLESEFNERQKGLLDEALKLSKGNKRDAAKMLNLAYTTYLSKRIKFGLDTKTKSTNEKTL